MKRAAATLALLACVGGRVMAQSPVPVAGTRPVIPTPLASTTVRTQSGSLPAAAETRRELPVGTTQRSLQPIATTQDQLMKKASQNRENPAVPRTAVAGIEGNAGPILPDPRFLTAAPKTDPKVSAFDATALPVAPALTKAHAVEENKAGAFQGPAPIPVCKSPRLVINFDVKSAASTAVSGVDLWHTRDGQKWHKLELPPKQRSCVIEVNKDGVYGFTVMARGSDGSAPPPPQPGDAPQIWTEVDLTKPAVELLDVQIEQTPSATNRLIFLWKADDKNLKDHPITILYAEKPAGPWTKVAANLDNAGSYEWNNVPVLPARFFVRVEAEDKAGHVGIYQTHQPLDGSWTKPHATITSIQDQSPRPATNPGSSYLGN